MQAVLKVPDDPVSALKAQFSEYGEQYGIQWDDCASIHVVAHFPADASLRLQCADALAYDPALLLNVIVEMDSLLVFLPQVVGGRGNHKLKGPVGDGLQELQAVAAEHHDSLIAAEAVGDLCFLKHLHENS